MCSQYTAKLRESDLEKEYGISNQLEFDEFDKRIFPRSLAPVIIQKDGYLKLVEMQFSLIPSWSKVSKPKFATHNARLETVAEKPAFKVPFVRNHCVIPMSDFYEAVYEGPFGGNVIEFKPKDSNLVFAAGIYDTWVDKETGQIIDSFSIITSEPSQFVKHHGHDRSPLFIEFKTGVEWLKLKEPAPKLVNFLNTRYIHPNFIVNVDRPLKSASGK